MRAFFAVELPTGVREALASVRDEFAQADAAWRDSKWVPPGNLHVTVRFLGETEESAAGGICEVLTTQLAEELPPRLEFAGLAAEPGIRRARMLWATFHDEDDRLARIAGIVDAVAGPAAGAAPDSRPFVPHVTLSRARRPIPVSADLLSLAEDRLVGRFSAGRELMSVPSITLFRSTLTRQGPVYEAISSMRIGS